jgi:hypothetical protein
MDEEVTDWIYHVRTPSKCNSFSSPVGVPDSLTFVDPPWDFNRIGATTYLCIFYPAFQVLFFRIQTSQIIDNSIQKPF